MDLWDAVNGLFDYLNEPMVQAYAAVGWQILQALATALVTAVGAVRGLPWAVRRGAGLAYASTYPARWMYRQACPPPPPPPEPVPPTPEEVQQAELLAVLLDDLATAEDAGMDGSGGQVLTGTKLAVAITRGVPTEFDFDGTPITESLFTPSGWQVLCGAVTDRCLALERARREAAERKRRDDLARQRAALLARAKRTTEV